MPRDYRVSLDDMLGSLTRIGTLTSGTSFEKFTRGLFAVGDDCDV
ncbi:MAG: hypothetical protein AB1646_05140 [Thermodesulfobacteriota bacterium]